MELFIFFLVGIPYLLLITALTLGFLRIKLPKGQIEQTRLISVIVPFKDEILNLPQLITDLSQQTYAHYEVLLIADHVKDGWLERLKSKYKKLPNLHIVSSPNRGKKGALKHALSLAKGDIIAYTDADCRVSPHWLTTINNHFDKETNMVLGPVIISPVDTPFERIQALEVQSLMASTAGSVALGHPIMSSGANMAVRKSVYQKLPAHVLNESVSSGDDMFLMMNLQKQFKGSIKFMKEAKGIVSTLPENSIKAFFRQRMRWTSKSTSYTSLDVISSAVIVLLANTLILGGFLINPKYTFVFLVIKMVVDFPILYLSTTTLKGGNNLSVYLITEILYPFYVVISAFGGLLVPLKWKGEKVRK